MPGVTQIADSGSASSPALWWLGHGTVTPDTARFVIGGSGKNYNQLTVDADYSFTASNDLLVGATNLFHNPLKIQAGGDVTVSRTLQVGDCFIMYYISLFFYFSLRLYGFVRFIFSQSAFPMFFILIYNAMINFSQSIDITYFNKNGNIYSMHF